MTAATSPVVVVVAVATGVLLLVTARGLGPGWVAWRRGLVVVAVLCAAYPVWWVLAEVVSDRAPGSAAAWTTAVVALVGHVPLLAAFSLLPVVATGYLGRGSSRVVPAGVVGLAGAAVVMFALYFDDFAPLRANALVDSPTGEVVGASVNAVFLATVLLGPAVPLLAAHRADGEAARRLSRVALSALGGAAVVMLCGALGSAADLGGPLVLTGMYAAIAAVALGSTRALRTPGEAEAAPAPTPATSPATAATATRVTARVPDAAVLPALTPREREVLALLSEGLSNAGIAARLVLSERTVDAHLRSVFAKLALPEGPLDNRRVHAVLAWRESVGPGLDATVETG